MNTPVFLSGSDALLAAKVFKEQLDEPTDTVTLLLVLWEDEVAKKGREYVSFLLETHSDDYASVAFIFVPDPALLLPELKLLSIKIEEPAFSLDNLYEYAILSVSPDNNFISSFVTKEDLDEHPSLIKIAVLNAWSKGRTLISNRPLTSVGIVALNILIPAFKLMLTLWYYQLPMPCHKIISLIKHFCFCHLCSLASCFLTLKLQVQ